MHGVQLQPEPLPTPYTCMVYSYGLRWLFTLLVLELLTHKLYFNSIAKHRVLAHLARGGRSVLPLHVALTGFWVLVFMWLKVKSGSAVEA